MTAAESPTPTCDECDTLPGDFVCAGCYIYEGKTLPGEDDGTDDVDPGPVDDLADLSEGDAVLWGDRSVPGDIVDTSFGSHVVVEGPNGATYRIQPIPSGGFRFGDRGGTVDDFRTVNTHRDEQP